VARRLAGPGATAGRSRRGGRPARTRYGAGEPAGRLQRAVLAAVGWWAK